MKMQGCKGRIVTLTLRKKLQVLTLFLIGWHSPMPHGAGMFEAYCVVFFSGWFVVSQGAGGRIVS